VADGSPKPTRREWLQTIAAGAGALALHGCRTRSDTADVCIVGSGPAGAILAWRLASRGVRVVLLEGGANPVTPRSDADRPSVAARNPLRYPTEETRFLGEGGTSNLWGGECPRLQPADFAPSNPSAPPGAPWPISWNELEPFYCQAESELSIAGGWENRLSPPRSQDFPVKLDASASAECLRSLLGKAGYVAQPGPISRTPRILTSHLPKLAALARVTFLRDVRVTRIIVDQSRAVSRLEARDRSGRPRTIEAHHYVLACGGIETPRLLLRSGLGNDHDQVGRHFMEHLAVDLGTYELPSAPGCASVETALTWQFAEEFARRGLGTSVFEIILSPADRLLNIGAILEMRPAADNHVQLSASARDAHGEPAAALTIQISDHERNSWKYAADVAGRIGRAFKAKPTQPAHEEFLWCHHHMGTCRMGSDPRTSVVNRDLRVHDVDNLYVAGSAVFVTAGAGSPTLLLTALGVRLADHLLARVTTPAV
jgi:choline dehydrogenase-like flavoprotein